ncbi:MAG: outer membrane beta-barrel family protein, partial [Muribaculaceae bacterium]|nr:outer membrane beta-barrel family protein [Muribaculaceae bacterium]
PDRQTHSYGFNSDVSVFLPFGLELTTDLAFSNSTGYSSGFNSKQWLWNAQISYSFLKSKELTFSVRAYDLLGQKKNISRSVGANSIVDSWFNDLTRYVMFGLTWNFNTLSKKGKGPDGESDMLPPLPPAGGPGMRHGPGPGGRRPF